MWRVIHRLQASGRHPVVRLLLLVVMALAAVAAAAVGAVVLVILLMFAVILFTVLYLRAQWMRRQLGLNLHPRRAQDSRNGVTLEGEFTVHRADSDKPERKV